MKQIVIVGSIAYDEIETPHGRSGKILGGAATYSSFAAAYFDVQVKIISVVGGDFKPEYIELFKKRNIDITGLEIKKDEKTFYWHGKYLENMNKRQSLITDLNVLEKFDPIVPESYKEPDILLLANLSPIVQLSVIKQLKRRPRLIVLDTMDFWIMTKLEELMAVFKNIDVLTINDQEAFLLSGQNTLRAAASKILEMGPKYVIIKKGEHGALLFTKEKIFFAPALPLYQVFDPTGAGDTFAGGLCGYLATTNDYSFENLKNGVITGSVLASFTVEDFGTNKLQNIKTDEIINRIGEFIELVKFNFPKTDKIFNKNYKNEN